MKSGQTTFFSQFEPVVYPSTLAAADFDLVCFGHIHRLQQLDGCKNTFYCGAISALNFNDEGQQRGYYIHDIDDSGAVEPFPKKRTQKVKKKWNDSRGIRYRWLCSGAEKIILKTRGRNPTQSRVRAEGVVEDFQIGKDIALRRRSGWIVF